MEDPADKRMIGPGGVAVQTSRGNVPHHSSRMARWLFPVYLRGARWLRENHFLIRRLFGVRLPRDAVVSWDWTTLVLKRALTSRLSRGQSVLEVGVGQGALLTLLIARRCGVAVDGIDILPERVHSAQSIVAHNNASIRIWQSDLFDHVTDRYDCIFFNAAYIPTEFGANQQLTERGAFTDDRAWNGGDSGTEIMVRFLAGASDVLTPGGEVLLGLSNFYVPDALMQKVIAASPLDFVTRFTTFANPSAVYVLRRGGIA